MTSNFPSQENISQDWTVTSLRSLCVGNSDIVGGPFGSNLKVSDYKSSGVPIIQLQNIARNKFIYKDIKFLSEEKAKDLDYHSFKSGDIVLAKLGIPIGKTCIVPEDMDYGIVVADVVRIRVNKDVADKNYICYVLNTNNVEEQLRRTTRGSTRPRVNLGDIRNILIPLPKSVKDQRKIASILTDLRDLIHKQKKVIENTQELRASLLDEIFHKGARQASLKSSEIGMIPENWSVVPVDRIANVKGGKRLPKGHSFSNKITKYPYLRIVDFKNGSIDTSKLKYLSEEDFHILQNYAISTKDCYISIAGTIGICGVIQPEIDGAILTENAAKLVFLGNDISNKFISQYLSSESGQEQIRKYTAKSTQPKLALVRIKQIFVPIPNLEEQIEIVKILDSFDLQLRLEKNKLSFYEELFESMLDKLMLGQVDVKDIEIN